MGNPRLFTAVYTRQKRQKRKKWLDGIVSVSGNKLKLYKVVNGEECNATMKRAPIEVLDSRECSGGIQGEHEFETYLVDIMDAVDDAVWRENNALHANTTVRKSADAKPIMKRRRVDLKSALDCKQLATVNDLSHKAEVNPPGALGQRLRTPLSTVELMLLLDQSKMNPSVGEKNPRADVSTKQTSKLQDVALESNTGKETLGSFMARKSFSRPRVIHTNVNVNVGLENAAGVLRLCEPAPVSADRFSHSCASFESFEAYTVFFSKAVAQEIQFSLDKFSAGMWSKTRKMSPQVLYDRKALLYRKVDKDGIDTTRYFLTSASLATYPRLRKGCRLGDIWCISTNSFESLKPSTLSRVWLFRSLWHGSTADGSIELVPISSNFVPRKVSKQWQTKTPVFAMMTINSQNEFQMLSLLEDMVETPLLSSLLSKQVPSCNNLLFSVEESLLESAFKQVADEFSLNEHQLSVLRALANHFSCGDSGQDVVHLVHGVYGGGKTKTIVASCVFLARLSEHIEPRGKLRVCIAASTNVAVDNVLKGLKRFGFEKFCRVGHLASIDREVRAHTVYFSPRGGGFEQVYTDVVTSVRNDKTCQDYSKELECISVPEAKAKQEELVNSSIVVGVTCCSSAKPLMETFFGGEMTKTICILDESSQSFETTSLMPICKSNANVLVCVGDPQQLDPLSAGPDKPNSLKTPMFVRLRDMGCEPIYLKTQYRCHPDISNLCSRLFYRNQVENGVRPEQRPALVDGLPPLAFFDITDAVEERVYGGDSFSNEGEARVLCRLIRWLIDKCGLEPSSIGAIALYRAQVVKITNYLARGPLAPRTSLVTVSTVDAFQGGEKDIILISCCRTTNTGFTDCEKRLNVMLSRARNHVLIFGNKNILATSQLWKQIILSCSKSSILEEMCFE